MRTKKYTALLLAAALALSLMGCGAENETNKDDQDGSMTIAPAQLTEEESALADLLALGMESYRIFQFQAEGAKALSFHVYELVGSDWSPIPGGGEAGLAAETGRIALTFGKMTDGVRLALKTQGGETISTNCYPQPADDVSAMTFTTSVLGESKAIELEKEIPLAVQVVTTKQEISFYNVDYFGMPREYAQHGYEHVYAITVAFSAQGAGTAPDAAASTAPAEPSAEPSPAE